jgi:hypothetical protein
MNLGNVTMTTDKVKLLLVEKRREKNVVCLALLSEIKNTLLTPDFMSMYLWCRFGSFDEGGKEKKKLLK